MWHRAANQFAHRCCSDLSTYTQAGEKREPDPSTAQHSIAQHCTASVCSSASSLQGLSCKLQLSATVYGLLSSNPSSNQRSPVDLKCSKQPHFTCLQTAFRSALSPLRHFESKSSNRVSCASEQLPCCHPASTLPSPDGSCAPNPLANALQPPVGRIGQRTTRWFQSLLPLNTHSCWSLRLPVGHLLRCQIARLPQFSVYRLS